MSTPDQKIIHTANKWIKSYQESRTAYKHVYWTILCGTAYVQLLAYINSESWNKTGLLIGAVSLAIWFFLDLKQKKKHRKYLAIMNEATNAGETPTQR
jgi:ATP/ADP translocase